MNLLMNLIYTLRVLYRRRQNRKWRIKNAVYTWGHQDQRDWSSNFYHSATRR